MWDLAGNPEDRFSHKKAHFIAVIFFFCEIRFICIDVGMCKLVHDMERQTIFHLHYQKSFLKYEWCPENCKFAVFWASLVIQNRFTDAISSYHRSCPVSTSCTLSHIATLNQ